MCGSGDSVKFLDSTQLCNTLELLLGELKAQQHRTDWKVVERPEASAGGHDLLVLYNAMTSFAPLVSAAKYLDLPPFSLVDFETTVYAVRAGTQHKCMRVEWGPSQAAKACMHEIGMGVGGLSRSTVTCVCVMCECIG